MTKARDLANIISGSGTLNANVIPALPASKITSGTFADARLSSSSVTQHVDLTSLSANNLTSGTVPSARLSLSASDVPDLATSKITSGTFADARISSSSVTAHVDLTALDASNLTSGTIPNARYGTPTFNGSNLTNMSVSSSTGSFSLGHSHLSLSVNSARYVKVGRICTVHFYGRNTNTTSGGGGIRVYFTGLPFTSWNSGNIVGGGNLSARHRFGAVGGWNLVVFNNSTSMYVRYDGAQNTTSTTGSDEMSIREDHTQSNKYFVGTCTYITAS